MARNWTIDFSDEALAEQISQAKKAAIAEEKAGPCAHEVEYDPQQNLIVFYFTNGSQFAVPPNLIQGLQGATVEQLNDVWLDQAGLSVHWPSLDADFSILGLVQGIFGTKAWMAEIGRQGGKQTSEAKRRSSRENGKKGGRPPKPAVFVAKAPSVEIKNTESGGQAIRAIGRKMRRYRGQEGTKKKIDADI
jgi:hypothetical protein